MNATLSALFSTMFFLTAFSVYAEGEIRPKNDASYEPVQQESAMDQWKEMRQESDLTKDAGKKDLYTELTEKPRNKAKGAVRKKIGEAVSEKIGKATPDKTKESDSQKAGAALTEKAGAPPKTTKTNKSKVANKKEKPDSASNVENADGAGKARTPDGTTQADY